MQGRWFGRWSRGRPSDDIVRPPEVLLRPIVSGAGEKLDLDAELVDDEVMLDTGDLQVPAALLFPIALN